MAMEANFNCLMMITDFEIICEKVLTCRADFLDFCWPKHQGPNRHSSLKGRKWPWGPSFRSYVIRDFEKFVKNREPLGILRQWNAFHMSNIVFVERLYLTAPFDTDLLQIDLFLTDQICQTGPQTLVST